MRFVSTSTALLLPLAWVSEGRRLSEDRVEFRAQTQGSLVSKNCRVSIPSWQTIARTNVNPENLAPALNLRDLCVNVGAMTGPSVDHQNRVVRALYNVHTSGQRHAADIDCYITSSANYGANVYLATYTVYRGTEARFNVMTASVGHLWGHRSTILQNEKKDKLAKGLAKRVCASLVPKLDRVFKEYQAGGYENHLTEAVLPVGLTDDAEVTKKAPIQPASATVAVGVAFDEKIQNTEE